MRLAVLRFTHEAVTFLARETTRADLIDPGSPASGGALLATDPTQGQLARKASPATRGALAWDAPEV